MHQNDSTSLRCPLILVDAKSSTRDSLRAKYVRGKDLESPGRVGLHFCYNLLELGHGKALVLL